MNLKIRPALSSLWVVNYLRILPFAFKRLEMVCLSHLIIWCFLISQLQNLGQDSSQFLGLLENFQET